MKKIGAILLTICFMLEQGAGSLIFAATPEMFSTPLSQESISVVAQTPSQQAQRESSASGLVAHRNESQLLSAQSLTTPTFSNPVPAQSLYPWMVANQDRSNSGLLASHTEDDAFVYHEGHVAEWAKIYAYTQAYTYDQALAGIAFLKAGNKAAAKKIFDFYAGQFQPDTFDGFWTVYNVDNAYHWKKYEWRKGLGENAWLGLFMLHYAESASGDENALQIAVSIAKWITTLPQYDGGAVAMSKTGNHSRIISTENDLDALSLLNRVKDLSFLSVADRTSMNATAAGIKNWLKTKAYNPITGLFLAGGTFEPATGTMRMNVVPSLDVDAWAISSIGPEVLERDFGINLLSYVQKIEESSLIQKSDNSFGGDFFTSKGFDYSNAENARRLKRGALKSVEVTNQMILSYRVLEEYFSKNAVLSASFRKKAEYLLALNEENTFDSPLGLSLTYADQVGLPIYAHTPKWKTFAGGSMSSVGWVVFASEAINPFFQESELGSLTPKAESLWKALLAKPGLLEKFVYVYGTGYVLNRKLTDTGKFLLDSVIVYPGSYDQKLYLEALEAVHSFIVDVRKSPALVKDFNKIYGVDIQANPRELRSIGTIFDLVSQPGFVKKDYLALLSKSSLFLDKIRVSQASLNAFNTLFDQYIPMIGGLHGAQIGFLFDGLAFSSVLRVQDATATPSQKSVYHKAADLLAGLRASSRSLDDFKRIYSISIPFSGNISDISLRVKLIQIVTDPSAGVFSETAYIARLRQASAMLSGIRASESLLAQVNTLYGSSFRISGPLGESDIALLMQGIITPGAFNQPVLANASDFLARMYADPDLERAFETIYGVLVPTAGSGTSAILRQTLIDMVSWASATGAPYVGNERHAFILKRAGSFLHFLRSTDKNRLVINTLFGTRYDSFAKTGIFKAVNRHQLLSDIASGVIKPEDLDSSAGPSRYELAYDLFQKMKISASHRIAFTNLYAINPGVGANVSVECRVILMGIVGYEFYDQSTFLGMMIRANSLFARIKASSVYRNAYNRRYANSIASLGATARDNRDHLYEIVTSPGYIENDFLKWLVQP